MPAAEPAAAYTPPAYTGWAGAGLPRPTHTLGSLRAAAAAGLWVSVVVRGATYRIGEDGWEAGSAASVANGPWLAIAQSVPAAGPAAPLPVPRAEPEAVPDPGPQPLDLPDDYVVRRCPTAGGWVTFPCNCCATDGLSVPFAEAVRPGGVRVACPVCRWSFHVVKV